MTAEVLDAVDKLECSTCWELSRPTTVRSANLKPSTEFNENALLDEDEAPNCFTQGWLSWAGPPNTLYFDAAKGHITKVFAEVGDRHNILMRLTLAEAPHLTGRVERAIDFKDTLQKVNCEIQITKKDDPAIWTAIWANTLNNHIRRNGFTPYQCVLGRSPNVATSLTETGSRHRAQHYSSRDPDGQSRYVQVPIDHFRAGQRRCCSTS
ncbi:unnamed protein product [Prorocentrum cordatum]|uniref:NudC domain-containing protein 1 n=1 Tax=Prorocentrum cordatum TaxID=2364126 RepID=A0ABN9RZM1_9DINO|nr:unnamed protein product [Polarella glacialis]